ncbi:MAG: rhodanese-like domain-containing protein [Gammaproteobacteria bacterium]
MSASQLFEFSSNHPVLILTFFVVFGLLILLEFRHRMSGMKSVGPIEATQLNNHNNAIFLDIRDDNDFKTGHIPDALNIPLKQLNSRAGELEKYTGQPIIAYCRSGNTSLTVGSILKKHGMEQIYNLSGGIVGWKSANMPLTK